MLTASKSALVAATSLVLLVSVLGPHEGTGDAVRPGGAGSARGAAVPGITGIAGVAGVTAGASETVRRAMDQHGCTETGFGAEATPRSALIVRAGQLEHVSFDQGWSVFVGDRPGQLLAVCLGGP